MVRLNRHLSAEQGDSSSHDWEPPGEVVGGTAGPLLPAHPSSNSSCSTSALYSKATAPSDRKTTSWDDVSKRLHSSDV